MKKIIILFLIFSFNFSAPAQESGIHFFHGNWEKAVALAKKEKKKIFIDFFTEWCGPCLNMALTVFPLPQVGEVYNNNFVCLKMDAEKGEGRKLAQKFGVTSYPTYVFVNPKTQELIHRSGGNKPAADFIADTQGALNPKLSSIYLQEKYNSGKYDAAFLIDYIRGQKISGNRNVQKDFARLLEMGCKLTDKEIWELYCECIGGYKNPYVKQISENYRQFTDLFGKETVDTQLTAVTAYAPIAFLEKMCDFEGKAYNLKMAQMTSLFRSNKDEDAWKFVDKLIADTTIDQGKFVKQLSFYTRINPKYTDDDLSFTQLVKKTRYARYVAYNMYDREDVHVHYNYAAALEYLIRRSLQEKKQIPADLLETPAYGKKIYDMRNPQLKQKPAYRQK